MIRNFFSILIALLRLPKSRERVFTVFYNTIIIVPILVYTSIRYEYGSN